MIVGGVSVASLRYLFSHAEKHKEVDDKLEAVQKALKLNDDSHGVMRSHSEAAERELKEVKELLIEVKTDMKWLKQKNGGGSK